MVSTQVWEPLLSTPQPGLLLRSMNHPPAVALHGSQKQLALWQPTRTSGISVDLAWAKETGFPSCWDVSGMLSPPLRAQECAECTSALLSTATFLLVAKMRLYVLLMKQEENSICSVKDWVVREASNRDALQEAGTFRYRQERKPGAVGGWRLGAWLSELRGRFLPNL